MPIFPFQFGMVFLTFGTSIGMAAYINKKGTVICPVVVYVSRQCVLLTFMLFSNLKWNWSEVFIHENLSSLSLIHVSVRLETRVCLPENLEDLYLVDLFRQFDLI